MSEDRADVFAQWLAGDRDQPSEHVEEAEPEQRAPRPDLSQGASGEVSQVSARLSAFRDWVAWS